MRNSILFASAALVAIPGAAQAACEPGFMTSSQSVNIVGVDVEPGAVASATLGLNVRNEGGTGDQACPAVIRVSRVGASADPSFPAFTLLGPGSQTIEILPDPSAGGSTASDVNIINALPAPQGLDVPFVFRVPTEWGIKAGTYSEQLRFSLYDVGGTLRDTATVTVSITIPRAVSVRLVGAVLGASGTGPARVDMGTLSSSTETRSPDFAALIFSTGPYMVSFASANLGNLLNENGHDKIGYELYFDGQRVDLAGVNGFPYAAATSSLGDFRPLRVIVPAVDAAAGRYTDRVTVTVSAT
jgi:hypothetical protein